MASIAGIAGLTPHILGEVLKVLKDARGPLAGELTNVIDQAVGTAETVTDHIVKTVFEKLHENRDTVVNILQQQSS